MEKYIIPQIIKYQNIDDLLESNNQARSLFNIRENLSLDKLLKENYVCIVGEPGIGKSRLVEEIINSSSPKTIYQSTASCFKSKSVPDNSEYCIIDALDEVEGNLFFSTLQTIKEYKAENPDTKVVFTCRKHYVASYAKHFASCTGLIFVELCRLKDEDVKRVIDNFSEITKANITKSPKLKELLSIPRYLTFLLENEEQEGNISNINNLFEIIIGSSINNAVKARYKKKNNESIKILIQRVLEKVAFIMEISRKDQISKDDLYTILDGVKGNMTHMLVANFDLLFFENRILKNTNGTLQFENSELQEYLAAKELCRLDNVESVLYDVAVQKDLKHIYPNWYDIIPHISYTKDRVHTFINIIKLIVSYESSLENDSFESLLRYIDPSILLLQQKEELFSIILEHYLRVPAYIGWKSQILKLIRTCYSSKCNTRLMPSYDQLNKIQLSNICSILEVIVEDNELDKDVACHWTAAANTFMQRNNKDYQLAAIKLYNVLNNKEELIRLAVACSNFSEDVKDKYFEITGYGRFTNKEIVNCWLEGCHTSNPYALNAVLCIEEPSTLNYAYNEIIKANKISEFFNPKGEMCVFYESYLKKQFNIAWEDNLENKILLTKIIAGFIDNHSYTSYNELNPIIRQILLDEQTGSVFISCFEKSKWDLEILFSHFETELVDSELISTVDKLLQETKTEKWLLDFILTNLINKIRNDDVKSASVSDYISQYAETFDRWDKNPEEEDKRKQNNPTLIKAYQSLLNPEITNYEKYNTAYKLTKNIEFLQKQDPEPLVEVVESFFKGLNLDETKLEKKDDSSYSISLLLVPIPYYVKALYHLGFQDLLKKHRIVLAKTLPFICCTANFNPNEIKRIYKSVIGGISDKEKTVLIDWWKSRKDDLMNISSDSVFACITDYGINALSYKLEEYIADYIENQDFSHSLAASKSLDLISKGYLKWDVEKYRNLFNALTDDNIESVKMLCNAIMIEKYQDTKAITWRIDYLKNHVLQSFHNNTGHVRVISIEESEMTNPNPRMFRCFMNINGNEVLDNHMLRLFDVGLSLCDKPETQEYASYLLRQIYLFFINKDNDYYILELRKKVETFNEINVCFLANNIMTNAEMMFLKKEKISVDKAIKLYNKCIEESHIEIRNDDDLRRYFTHIHSEVQKEIQDQGIYSLVQGSLSEDFIQRELKNTIINKCCQLGLNEVQVDREVTLQDNKRTDLLIRYGFCNPIMVELKLLHNKEIQNTKNRQDYKNKFIQYSKATNACLSVFWIFDVHKTGSDITKFKDLEIEYKELENTRVLLTDCKCSSGFDSGLCINKQTSMLTIRGTGKKRK